MRTEIEMSFYSRRTNNKLAIERKGNYYIVTMFEKSLRVDANKFETVCDAIPSDLSINFKSDMIETYGADEKKTKNYIRFEKTESVPNEHINIEFLFFEKYETTVYSFGTISIKDLKLSLK